MTLSKWQKEKKEKTTSSSNVENKRAHGKPQRLTKAAVNFIEVLRTQLLSNCLNYYLKLKIRKSIIR